MFAIVFAGDHRYSEDLHEHVALEQCKVDINRLTLAAFTYAVQHSTQKERCRGTHTTQGTIVQTTLPTAVL